MQEAEAGTAEADGGVTRYIPATQLCHLRCRQRAATYSSRVPITKNNKGQSTTRLQEFQVQWERAVKEVVTGEYYDPASNGQ